METLDKTRDRVSTGTGAATHAVSRPPAAVRLAYLLSQYPAISHTFFLHEVLGLRARGVEIETASINKPDRPLDQLPATEAAEAAQTEYIKSAGAAGKLLAACCTHPIVLLRGLLAVLQTPRLSLRQRGLWLLYLAEAMLTGAWMKRRNLHHLHVHFGGAVASVGLLTARAWRIPWSLTIHGPEELLNVDAYHLREKVTHAAFVICISDFCRSQLCQVTPPNEWDKFQVARLGVDPVVLTPSLSPTPQKNEQSTFEIVCVGRLVAAKGHRVLLEALRLLHAQDLHPHLTLIGGGPELPALEKFVAQHGLGASITFTSALSHDKALAHVRRANAFVLASFAEGIPVALMEAMSLGVPCVSTTIAGIPELIASGTDGLLVPPANAPALASALASLMLDEPYRQQLAVAARQRIIRDYNLPLNHELLSGLFAANLSPISARSAR